MLKIGENWAAISYGTFGSLQWEMCTNALFWPSLTPPANPVKFFWSKMACTCVPHIVLHVSCRTRTSGGYFRPSEVRFRAKIPLSSHWFYNVKTQKTRFLKKGPIKLSRGSKNRPPCSHNNIVHASIEKNSYRKPFISITQVNLHQERLHQARPRSSSLQHLSRLYILKQNVARKVLSHILMRTLF